MVVLGTGRKEEAPWRRRWMLEWRKAVLEMVVVGVDVMEAVFLVGRWGRLEAAGLPSLALCMIPAYHF